MWEVEREWYQAAKTLHFGLKLLVGLLIILFCTALFVDSAHAAEYQSIYDGVVWGIGDVEYWNAGNVLNVKQGCIVNAPNAFSAACFAVGGNPSTLTSDQKAYLSNASSGGDFYTFSQLFANYGGSFDTLDWAYVNFPKLWSKYETIYGDNLYAAEFSKAQLSGAISDYNAVVSGGGSGGAADDGTYTLQGVSSTYSGFGYIIGNSLYSNRNIPSTTKLTLNNSVNNYVKNKLNDGYDVAMYIQSTNANPSKNVQLADIDCFPHGTLTLDIVNVSSYNTQKINLVNNSGSTVIRYHAVLRLNKTDSTIDNFVYTGNTAPFGQEDLTNGNSICMGGGGSDDAGCFYLILYSDGTASTPQIPSNNWPDNPPVVTPIHNDVPAPTDPTINDQPIDPTPPQNPVYPPMITIMEDTYTADLQGILDAMDAHCEHLRSALHTEMSNLWTAISTKMTNDFSTFRTYMTGQIGWLGDLISDEMEATRDYLKDLFEWLADEIDITISGMSYDDNSLLSWLRRIYYRLGSGGVNTRPVDPVATPTDAGDWLSQLIANLFGALDTMAGGLLTSVGNALELMRGKFPFSLPWDLLAILALFEAPPTAPDFDVPIYTINSAGQLTQVGAWEIDLSDLSPYLEGIRWMQKICFVYFLAVHTKDWMDTLEKVVA